MRLKYVYRARYKPIGYLSPHEEWVERRLAIWPKWWPYFWKVYMAVQTGWGHAENISNRMNSPRGTE